MKRILKHRVFQIFMVILLLASSIIVPSHASEFDDLQNQINEKRAYLAGLEEQLTALDSQVSSLQYEHNGLSSRVAQLENELAQYEAKIKKNETIVEKLKEQISLTELELRAKQSQADEKMLNLYISSRQSKLDLIIGNGAEGFLDDYSYQSILIKADIDQITTLQHELDILKQQKETLDQELVKFKEENEKLAKEKADLETQLSQISVQLNSTASQGDGIRAEIGAVQGQVGDLETEQEALLNKEFQLMIDNPDMVGGPIEVGDFYFAGQGRDLNQGHGLGMSQWGAHGAALSGMNAQQIIQFYYTGVQVTADGNGTVDVIGIGGMNIEDYLAGLGEVPDKACGSAAQAGSNPAKYKADDPNTVWDCWPEESIKAQVIAARSYALSKGGSLFPDARDQVYKGGNEKRWAVNETAHKVARSNGAIIRAFYSSDNSQGRGTANHETIWSDYAGYRQYPLPYLRSVNDSGFATTTQWTRWGWTTGGFSYDDLNSLLIHSRDTIGGGASQFIGDVLNETGTVSEVDFIRDPSGRVWKVRLSGDRGSSEIAGWFFKNIWNQGAVEGYAPGFIYSLTFSLYQKS